MSNHEYIVYTPATLCEVCAKACGGKDCPWAEYGRQEPVPGWTAIRRDFSGHETGNIESYVVLECPLFELEEHNRWAYDRFSRGRATEQAQMRVEAAAKVVKRKPGRMLTVDGETKSVYQWCRELHFHSSTVYLWLKEKGEEYAVERLTETKRTVEGRT